MCFSATASFTTGAVLVVAGAVTLSKVRRGRHGKDLSQLAFAAIPLFFGLQQLIEGMVWISFSNAQFNMIATYMYAIFSHVFWPIYAPWVALMMEKSPIRKKMIEVTFVIGIAIGLYLLSSIIFYPVTSQITNNSICYTVNYFDTRTVGIIYLIGVSLGAIISSNKTVRAFGIGIVISAILATIFYTQFLVSTWCFFCAILSLIVYLHVAHVEKAVPQRTQ